MAEKDFVVKNGLVVNTDLIVADGDLNRVGINNSTPDATLTVTGTANVSGNVAIGANLTITDTVAVSRVLVGANVLANASTIFVGNSTVNSIQNSSIVQVTNSTSTANLTALDLKIGAAVVNSSQISVNDAARLNASALFLGNSTVNTVVNSLAIVFSNSVGGFSVNAQNYSGTANNATNFGGQLPAYYTNATNISTGTLASARLPTGNATNIGGLQIVDSLTNTSVTVAPTANNVKTAYDVGIAANTRAASAQTAASTAQTDATNANTRAASAQSAAIAAYSNAITFASNASNINTGTLASARISGAYTGITSVGTLGTLTVSGNVAMNNFTINASGNTITIASSNLNVDSGVLFVDSLNNRVGINNTNPDAALSVTGSANVTGNLTVLGNLIITGNTVSQGTQEFTGALTPAYSDILLGNTTNRWSIFGSSGNFSANLTVNTNFTVGNSTVNVSTNSTSIVLGNATVNVSINSTTFSGTSNNATYLNGQLASFYTNATNISTGTLASARLPTGNATNIGGLQLVDSVSNTSTTITASANSVTTAYNAGIDANTRASSAQTAAIAAYTNATTFASNATNISTGTLASARLPTGNATNIGGLQIVDSVANASATVAAAANSVKTAYDTAILANTRASSAQTAASDAYANAIAANTRAGSAQTAAIAAYTNAVIFAANASNMNSGIVSSSLLPTGNATNIGGLQLVDSVVNTSATIASSANSVKTAYDAAISANTRAASAQTVASDALANAVSANTRASSAQTAAIAAYTNATAFASNATNITTGTLPSAVVAGNYTGINAVGTLVGLAVTGNSNFDSGVLFIDGTNNRVGVNTSSPSISLQVASNDAILLPVGATADRPSGSNGMIRYNVDINNFEGFVGGGWTTVSTSGGGGYYKGNQGSIGNTSNKDNLFRINSNTISNNITISVGENAMTAGPMVIATGYNLTIDVGGRAVIV